MRLGACSAFLALLLLSSGPALAALAVVAINNADEPSYGPQPNHTWFNVNGAPDGGPSGYNLWNKLDDSTTGVCYMEGLGVNSRQVDGNFSFGLSMTNGRIAMARSLASAITGFGQFDINTRFRGAGSNLVNLRAAVTNTFSAGELISFGIVNGTQLGYTDLSGTHLLTAFDAREGLWNWTITFNTLAGTYSGLVRTNSVAFASFGGSLRIAATNMRSFAVSGSGDPGSVIFDSPTFSIPEPAAFSIVAAGIGALIFWRRERNTQAEAKPGSETSRD